MMAVISILVTIGLAMVVVNQMQQVHLAANQEALERGLAAWRDRQAGDAEFAYAERAYAERNEVVIRYASFRERPVELVLDAPMRRVIVRIKLAEGRLDQNLRRMYGERYEATDDEQFLISQVARFVVPGPERIPIGGTGLKFSFKDGYTVWGPHTTYAGPGGRYSCLLFAEHAEWNGDTIAAKGTREKIGYYPPQYPTQPARMLLRNHLRT